MKRLFLTVVVLAICVTSGAFADEPGDSAEKTRAAEGRRGGRPSREMILERFDTNGDGKLDSEERAAAEEAQHRCCIDDAPAARKEMMSRGTDGRNGRPGRRGNMQVNREEMLKKFDKNGNGRIDQNERQAVMQFVRQQQAGSGGQPRMRPERPGGRGTPNMSREELLKRFDKNGNGELDPNERQAVQQFMRQMMQNAGGGGMDRERMMEMAKQRFDRDGDGELNQQEQAAARRFVQQMMQQRGGTGRRGGLGPVAEPPKRPNRISPELLKRFDTDGDGELNAEERKAARAARDSKTST